jgi:cytochrome bd-type quinol oxidase subunit 1
MFIGYLMFFTCLSFFLGSAGLGTWLYYFSEPTRKIDYMPIMLVFFFSGWAALFLAPALSEEELNKSKSKCNKTSDD